MQNNVFQSTFRKHAVLATMAGACLVPHHHADFRTEKVPLVEGMTNADPVMVLQPTLEASQKLSVEIKLAPQTSGWSKELEKEFRQLALEEAKSMIPLPLEKRFRLDELNDMRNTLYNRRSGEDIFLEMRRARVIEKMADALREYVDFLDATDKKRPSA